MPSATGTSSIPAVDFKKTRPTERDDTLIEATPEPELPPEGWTRERVAKAGVLGQERSWISELMNTPFWTREASGDGLVYTNSNEVTLTYIVPRGRVTAMTVRFPATATSADLTAVSGLMIGNERHLPVHFEAYRRPNGDPLFGDFQTADGRRFYYRGTLRTTGDPPFGPAEFSIATSPFPEQPRQLEVHKDEHLAPRQPVPIDAGVR